MQLTPDYAASLANSQHLRTVAINANSSGDNTLHTVTAGKRWLVYHFFIQAEADVSFTVKSGSTAITGAVDMASFTEQEFDAGMKPVFYGRAVGDNLVLNLSGAVQVNGYVNLAEIDQ